MFVSVPLAAADAISLNTLSTMALACALVRFCVAAILSAISARSSCRKASFQVNESYPYGNEFAARVGEALR
jgi:hypothetical protein